MLTPSHYSALKTIYDHLYQTDIIWALTGSTAVAVHGMDWTPNDIDIKTDEAGGHTG